MFSYYAFPPRVKQCLANTVLLTKRLHREPALLMLRNQLLPIFQSTDRCFAAHLSNIRFLAPFRHWGLQAAYVYFNLGDFVKKGQILARMHSHDVHEAPAAYATALAEQSLLQSAEALAQKNYDRSRRLYELKAEALAQPEIARQEVTNAEAAEREAANNVLREEAHLSEILGLRPNPSPDAGENVDLIPIVA